MRELEQLLVRSRLLSQDGVMQAVVGGTALDASSHPGPVRPLSAADRDLHARLSEALAVSKGNVTKAARTLGKGRVHVHRLIRRLKIDPRQFRT